MKLVCDFCSSPDPVWRHYAKPFTIRLRYMNKELNINMSEDWAACNICHFLIVNEEWDALLDRSLRTSEPEHKPFIEEVHQGFRENQTGAFTPK